MSEPEDLRQWPDLHDAQRAVLAQIIVHGAVPRVELARRLSMSRTSLTRLTKELIDMGFIEEVGSQSRPTRGRPPELINIRTEAANFVGVKLTGDALYAVLTNLGSEILDRVEVPLEARDVASVTELISQVSQKLLAGHTGPGALGVCLAGDTEDIDGISYVVGSAFLGWDSPIPLSRLVTELTGLPTSVRNDVQALTAAHHWFGAGVGWESLVVIAVGVGVGSGLVVGDELQVGGHGRAGKIGHIVVESIRRPRCSLGHVSCVAGMVTMPNIAVSAGLEPTQYARALSLARRGDATASSAFEDAAVGLGAIVAQFINVIDPDKVIITGEGIDMLDLARDKFDLSVAGHLDARATRTVKIEVCPFAFDQYAWGAAISAIRDRF